MSRDRLLEAAVVVLTPFALWLVAPRYLDGLRAPEAPASIVK